MLSATRAACSPAAARNSAPVTIRCLRSCMVVPEYKIIWPLLIFYGVLQIFRAWILLSLGARWTTRIIVLKDAPLVRAGPYRYLKHPNYWLVCAEVTVLPLIFGAWPLALIFSALNGALLYHRIRVENAALEGQAK